METAFIPEPPSFTNGHDKVPFKVETALAKTADNVQVQYSVFSLNVNNQLSRLLLPDFVTRCVNFLTKYHVEMDPAWLTNTIYSNFQAGCQDALMLVGLAKDMKLFAHSFAIVQMMGKEPICYVLQVENDIKKPALIRMGYDMVQQWSKQRGLTKIVHLALDEKVMRLWRSQFGFTVHRYMMIKQISND